MTYFSHGLGSERLILDLESSLGDLLTFLLEPLQAILTVENRLWGIVACLLEQKELECKGSVIDLHLPL